MNVVRPIVLVILDGFGYRENTNFNAIAQARKPFFDYLWRSYPHVLLCASGECVGLPSGFMGNSEVGHLTLGAGRILPQAITRINKLIENGNFYKHPLLQSKFENFSGTLHLMGLLSDAGVHSHIQHLYAFLKVARTYNVKKIVVHPFLDGRDSPPQSAPQYLADLERHLRDCHGTIGTLSGRYYPMDRDKHWDRTQAYYDVLAYPKPVVWTDWRVTLDYYYHHDITDEFIPPTQLLSDSIIQDGDGIIFFNFRPDRARQLISAFTAEHFDHFERKKLSLSFFITPLDLIEHKTIADTLHEVLSRHGTTMFACAETEKYAHVTYFFDGGREAQWKGQERVLIPSMPLKNYVNHPCMSAPRITDAVIKSLQTNPKDFYLINYANADMVGHSGDLSATVKAIECLDQQLVHIYEHVVVQHNGILCITGDHGNAEQMWGDQAQQPCTSHTNNPVPFILIDKSHDFDKKVLVLRELSDIAPFILSIMNLPLPSLMTQTGSKKSCA